MKEIVVIISVKCNRSFRVHSMQDFIFNPDNKWLGKQTRSHFNHKDTDGGSVKCVLVGFFKWEKQDLNLNLIWFTFLLITMPISVPPCPDRENRRVLKYSWS